MELEEQIYVNIEDLGACSTKHQGPEEKELPFGTCESILETKPVRKETVAKEETETWFPFKAAAVCLGLLCFLLLTTVVGVGVRYGRDFNQLSRELANHTAEKDQLLLRYQNLTDQRDQLQTSYKNVMLELNKVMKKMGTCRNGWRQFGCSCYLLYETMTTWSHSRQVCLSKGADLVIITSDSETVFLNKLGAHLKFWIGLSESPSQRTWVWTDGSSLKNHYWQYRYPTFYSTEAQRCAAFNSFNAGIYGWGVNSWSKESCAQNLQYVCEKPAEMPLLS